MPIATSTIKLWKSKVLSPDKNYVVEDLVSYLGTADKTINNFQFLELKAKMTIKIVLAQYNLQFDNTYDYNYCHISRSQGSSFSASDGAYYFIKAMRWKSTEAIELDLEMDVLNTFTWNSDYVISDKTMVLREHRDRYSNELINFTSSYRRSTITWTAGTDKTITIYDDRLRIAGYSVDNVTVPVSAEYSYVSSSIDATLGSCSVTLHRDTGTGVVMISFTVKFVNSTIKYTRIVDEKSEGVNPILFKQKEENILDPAGDVTWLLHYSNENNINPEDYNQVNPVKCELLPRDSALFAIPTATGTITTSTIQNGEVFYYFYTVMGGLNFKINNTNEYLLKHPSWAIYYFVEIQNNSGQLDFRYGVSADYRSIGEGVSLSWNATINNCSSIVITNPQASVKVYKTNTRLSDAGLIASLISTATYNYTYTDGSDTNTTLIGSAKIDRTDSKNIKIIETPYCPTPIQDGGGVGHPIILTGEWEYQSGPQSFKLMNLDSKFDNLFVSNVDNPLNPLVNPVLNPIWPGSPNEGQLKSADYESKLYHSDYYKPKFVYDSFFLDFMLENVDVEKYLEYEYNTKLKVDFIMSRNMVSKFCFMFPQYYQKYSTQDYDNVVNVARNNEQVLYTSQYINYLRTGYNYDLKTKERSEVAGGIGIGLSALGLAASIALTATGVGAGAGVAGIIGSGLGLVHSISNQIKTVAQNEQNIAQKLSNAKNEAVSVQNADDVDLLDAYSGNRAKLCLYQVTPKMREALFDLFYYCGYITNEQKVPSTTSRYWFNFVQANLVVNTWQNIPVDIQEMIKNKFSDGVTFFHVHEKTIDGHTIKVWQFAQTYENWETWLLS